MLTESAVVVEVRLSIPVAVTPFCLSVRYRPGNTFLAEDFLAVHDSCNILNSCTITVLTIFLCGVIRVVRSFGCEAETLCKETHIELVLNIEIENVCTLVNITEVIVVRKCRTVERSYDIRVRNDMTALLVDTSSRIRSSTLEITEKITFTATHCGTSLHTTSESDRKLAVF